MVEPPEAERHPDIDYEDGGPVDESRAEVTIDRTAGFLRVADKGKRTALNDVDRERRLSIGILVGSAIIILAAVLPFSLIQSDGWKPAIGFYGASFLTLVFTGVGVTFAARRQSQEVLKTATEVDPTEDLEDILQEYNLSRERYASSPWAFVALQERTANKLDAAGAHSAAEVLMRESRFIVRDLREQERRGESA